MAVWPHTDPDPGQDEDLDGAWDDDGWDDDGELDEAPPGRLAPEVLAPFAALPAVWTAAAILHELSVSWYWPVAGTAFIVAVACGNAANRAQERQDWTDDTAPAFRVAEIAAAIAATGAWVTAATVLAPWYGTYGWLSVVLLAGTAAGLRWLWRHEVVLEARRARHEARLRIERQTWWHQICATYGLPGSHLLDYTETLLGEHLVIDTTGMRLLTSQIHTGHVEEQISQHEHTPMSRIEVFTNPHEPGGRLHIQIRRRNPWNVPVPHPGVHDGSMFADLVPAWVSAKDPLCLGVDPETGKPLTVRLWEPGEGGKVIFVVASKGSGKTVLLNDLMERLTACQDAVVIQINAIKVREEEIWAPVCGASALGPEQIWHARRLLQWACDEITARSKQLKGESKVTPSPATPLIVVKVDEYQELRKDPVCRKLLDIIASACRSEAVCLIGAAQRATSDYIGAKVRALTDVMVLGRFRRPEEALKATGGVKVPDMSRYGENHQGVWCVVELGAGGSNTRGRSFKLEDPADLYTIARRRRRPAPPRHRSPAQAGLWAQGTGAVALAPEWDDEKWMDGAAPPPPLLDAPGSPEPAEPLAGGDAWYGAGGPGLRAAGDGEDAGRAAQEARAGSLRERLDRIRESDITGNKDGTGTTDNADLSDEARARLDAENTARRAAWWKDHTDVDMTPDQIVRMLLMVERGATNKEAAVALLGGPEGRMTVQRWAARLVEDGLIVTEGKGSARRRTLTAKGDALLARLRAERAGADGT